MRRKVTGIYNYVDKHANGTKGTNILMLECGHVKSQKGSVAIPKTVQCNKCDGGEPKDDYWDKYFPGAR